MSEKLNDMKLSHQLNYWYNHTLGLQLKEGTTLSLVIAIPLMYNQALALEAELAKWERADRDLFDGQYSGHMAEIEKVEAERGQDKAKIEWLQTALDAAKSERDALANELEQCRVQLAGCLTAAEGGTKYPAKQGDYGWSLAYQKTLECRINRDGYGQLEIYHNEDAAKMICRNCGRELTGTGCVCLECIGRGPKTIIINGPIAELKERGDQMIEKLSEMVKEIIRVDRAVKEEGCHISNIEMRLNQVQEQALALEAERDLLVADVAALTDTLDKRTARLTQERDALEVKFEKIKLACEDCGTRRDRLMDAAKARIAELEDEKRA